MLTERQILILQVTVDDFIQTAQPVGSRQLSKKEQVPFSPATIRNEMADLEELGFLEIIQVNKQKQNFIKAAAFENTLKRYKL